MAMVRIGSRVSSMGMCVFMLQRFMQMGVRVVLGQVQPNSERH